ncbi:MAG: hypothetical protein JNJ77_09320 [Planctomycetia bacterium]|nr:hypothetical protein [Planctomycetia bacterium]
MLGWHSLLGRVARWSFTPSQVPGTICPKRPAVAGSCGTPLDPEVSRKVIPQQQGRE